MSKSEKSLDIIFKQGVLPLYFHQSEEVSIQVLKSLYEAGIRSVEYTNRGKEALQNFKALIAFRNSSLPGLELGIGTIKTAAEAKAFISAKADFIISPGFIPAVANESIASNVLWIPGCMTVSEIIQAEQLGAKFIKLFPGNILGPSFMSGIKDIFPGVFFMPTGGVELQKDNISAWFKSGVSAVGLGSKLISKELLEQKDYSKIQSLTKEAIAIVQSIQNPKA